MIMIICFKNVYSNAVVVKLNSWLQKLWMMAQAICLKLLRGLSFFFELNHFISIILNLVIGVELYKQIKFCQPCHG